MSSEAAADAFGTGVTPTGSPDGVILPEPILDVVEAYEAAGGGRDRYVWRWIYDLLPAFTLSTVPQSRLESVRRLKTELTIFVTLLDDLAERTGDVGTFDAICRHVQWPDATVDVPEDADASMVAFATDLWDRIDAGLRASPRHDEFRDVFDFDFRQVLNAMDYSRLLNDTLVLANLPGARHYDSHNMVVFPYADVDVVHSPGFDPADLGPTREVLWDLQTMARIGNWLTTWRRELREGDFSAGIVVAALRDGLVTPATLAAADADEREALIDGIHACGIERRFEDEWCRRHRRVAGRVGETTSVDLDDLLAGMETVMVQHLASEGRK